MASKHAATGALEPLVARRNALAYRELLDCGAHGFDHDGTAARGSHGQVRRPLARAVGPQKVAAVRSRHRARISTRRHG